LLKELERLHQVALVACMDVERDDKHKERFNKSLKTK